jgi:hypothetical protein
MKELKRLFGLIRDFDVVFYGRSYSKWNIGSRFNNFKLNYYNQLDYNNFNKTKKINYSENTITNITLKNIIKSGSGFFNKNLIQVNNYFVLDNIDRAFTKSDITKSQYLLLLHLLKLNEAGIEHPHNYLIQNNDVLLLGCTKAPWIPPYPTLEQIMDDPNSFLKYKNIYNKSIKINNNTNICSRAIDGQFKDITHFNKIFSEIKDFKNLQKSNLDIYCEQNGELLPEVIQFMGELKQSGLVYPIMSLVYPQDLFYFILFYNKSQVLTSFEFKEYIEHCCYEIYPDKNIYDNSINEA